MICRRATLIGVVLVAAGVLPTLALQSGGGAANATGSSGATTTAAVVRTTLASQEQVNGTLERAGSYTLVSQQSTGTLTELPTPGAVIARGQVLYRLDGQPVRLLYGTQAAWRPLSLGVSDGADVLQLKRNLKALGFAADGALTVNDVFDWATAVAIEDWQRAQGVAQTGALPLGTIAFLPGAVRVTAQLAVQGTPAQLGTQLLSLSSTKLAVSVPLDPSLRQLVHVGDQVQIQLPEGQTTPGRVTQIDADATAASGSQTTSTGSGSSSTAGNPQDANGPQSQSSGQPSASVPVTIALDHPRDARGLDQVPVEVSITDTVHRNVLAVPITALLALANGGYAVAVDAGGRQLIPVTSGIFNGNLVEVSSSRLRPGMRVEVASS